MLSHRGGQRPGAGRPPREPGFKRRRLSTTVSQGTWSVIQRYAERSDVAVSEALDALISHAATVPAVAELLEAVMSADGHDPGES